MNAAALRFDLQQSTEYCSTHMQNMISYRGRTFCEQCSLEAVDRSNEEHKHAVNTKVRENHFKGAQLPSRHENCGFSNYTIENNGQLEAKQNCAKFTKDFLAGMNRNLIMIGRPGTGKTHLACAVARNLLDQRKYVRYITSEDMANEIANAWKKADDSEANAIYRFTDTDLLILDEYGLHDQHESRLQLVHKVLYARYDENKPTMLISNFGLDGLKENLGDRLWSRFQHDGLTVVECNWADQRVGEVA